MSSIEHVLEILDAVEQAKEDVIDDLPYDGEDTEKMRQYASADEMYEFQMLDRIEQEAEAYMDEVNRRAYGEQG